MPRREHDAYYTPTGAVDELLKRRPILGRQGMVIAEPCVGSGAIAQLLRARGCLVVTNDLVQSIEADVHDDARVVTTWNQLHMQARFRRDGSGTQWTHDKPIDWTVTNPPFVAAYEILKRAIEHSRVGVAFFLRLSFLEPTEERGPFLAKHPPDELIVLPRISFTGDGATDSVTCAWMIWYTQDTYRNTRSIEIAPTLGEQIDDGQKNLWGA